MRRWLPESL